MAITTTGTIGKVRFLIGDDVDGVGVLPNGANFTDTQISDRLSEVGGNAEAAAAVLCRSLANRWAIVPASFSADGLSITRTTPAQWLTLAAQLQSQAANAAGASVPLDRRDAFSTYLDASGEDTERTYG